MVDKLTLIKKILETDPETDSRIMALIEAEEGMCRLPRSQVKEEKISIEERCERRKPVEIDAAINTGSEKIRAHAEDVSAHGAFICTEKRIEKGQDIAIRLITADGEEIPFISTVVRVEERGIGVQIKTISSLHQQRFSEFVNNL